MSLGLAIVAATFGGILVIGLLTAGIIIFAFRRVSPAREDPAVTELKRRLAAGEISPVEYEVRLRALSGKD
jgi:uncharacterized membrane protein